MMKLNVKPSNGREFDPLTGHHYSNVFFLLFAAGGFACCSFFVFTCVFLTRFFDFFYKGKIDTKFLSKNHASETETRSHR
jgi:hypothetical protein